jgi:hypothetical protein
MKMKIDEQYVKIDLVARKEEVKSNPLIYFE